MKKSDLIFYSPSSGPKGGIFRVRLFENQESKLVALITDINSGIGPSITNCVERMRTDLLKATLISESSLFIEQYEDNNIFALVEFSSENKPSWQSLSKTEATQLCGCQIEEIETTIADCEALQKSLYEERLRVDPNFFEIYEDSKDVLERRRDIRINMISKNNIKNLIQVGASEKELQSLLRKDLSILGEAHANLDEEYICFSEFPLSNGFVDFVILTGRSRMSVILIEIK